MLLGELKEVRESAEQSAADMKECVAISISVLRRSQKHRMERMTDSELR